MSKKLNPTDAFFLQVERAAAPMHIGSLARFSLPEGRGPEYILELVQSMRRHAISAEPFNYRLAQGAMGRWNPTWEIEEDIDLDYHIRHSALPQPGGERELAILISRLHSIPLDRARPLWEMHVIEGLADGTFAIYAKMHHALVDGVAAVKLMNRTFATQPAADAFVPMWDLPALKKPPKPTPDPSGRREALSGFVSQFGAQLAGIGRVTSALTQVLRGAKNTDLPNLVAPYSAPDCVLNGAIGPQRRVSTQDFALADFKTLAKAAKGTLNDVVMAVCGGALRNYLAELHALPSEPLIAQVPVSVRAGEDAGGGNAISMLLTNLATHDPDPKTRFASIKASLDDGKALLKRMSKSEIDQYSALLMAPFAIGQVAGIGNRSRKPMFNVVISNVPGPQDPLYLNQAQMLSCHPISLVFEGQALNITIFTYADKLSIIYTACRSSLPHVQHMVGHAQAAFDELCATFDVTPAGLAPAVADASPKRPAKAKPTAKSATRANSTSRRAASKGTSSKKAPSKAAARPKKEPAKKPAPRTTSSASAKVTSTGKAAPKASPKPRATRKS